MKTANIKTTKDGKTFNFYFFIREEYENNVSIEVENENLFFQGELVEMYGYLSDITQDDENAMFIRMNCSVSTIETIKENNCLIVTVLY